MVVLYLSLGVLADVLVTGYYLCVSRGRPLYASALSVGISLLNFFVLARVLVIEPNWWNALAYAAGNGIGSYAIMRWQKGR